MSLSLSQSDSQLARNEQLASPVLGMHLWHNELRPPDNSDEHDDYDDDHAARRARGVGASRGEVIQWALVPEARERPRGTIMLVLQFAKRRGYPAETLTLRPTKCHCESPAAEHDNNAECERSVWGNGLKMGGQNLTLAGKGEANLEMTEWRVFEKVSY